MKNVTLQAVVALLLAGMLVGCDSGSDMADTQAPRVEISSPGDGTTFAQDDTVTFEGSAEGPDGEPLTGEALTWDVSTEMPFGTGEPTPLGTGERVATVLPPAPHTVTLTATDPSGATARDTVSVAVDGPPVASITTPEDESGVDEGAVTLEGAGVDPVGGELGADRLEWSSDVDDDLGTGASLSPDLSPGPHTITLTATDADGNTASTTADIVVEQPGFNVRLRFLSDFEPDERETIREALAPWEDAITGDLRPFFPPSDAAASCLLQERGIDDLAVAVQKEDIDGPGGALAQAGPCLVRSVATGVFTTSASGVVTIDEADLDNPRLKDIVTHEVGHALGIGIGPIQGWGNNTNDLETLDPFHAGDNTTEAFDALESEAYLSEGVPLENTGGQGTAGAHWREANFDAELMTGFINPDSELPLSRVTLASLEDIGYEVDRSAADPFELPMPQQTIWRSVADATLSGPASSDENFGRPGGARIDTVLVAGSNNERLWSTDPEGEVFSGLVRFDVASSLPMGVTVNGAALRLIVAGRNAETSDHDVGVFPVDAGWSEGNVTRNNRPAVRDSVERFDFESCDECTLELTDLVLDWVNGTVENHGVALRAPDAGSDSTFSVGFFSRHVETPFSRPLVVVSAETEASSPAARARAQQVDSEAEEKIPLGEDIRSGPLIGVDAEGRVVRTERLRPDRIR